MRPLLGYPSPMSELRAHFPEREAYLDRLAQHYADGLLDDAGFEARRDLLLQATTPGEMLRAFDGLPRPRYRDEGTRGRGVARRGILIGGLAVAAAGAVALGLSTLGARPYAPPAEEFYLNDPVETSGMEAFYATVDYGVLDETFMTLRERGLSLVSEFTADTTGATGVAMSPRAPGDLRTFDKRIDRTVVVSEATPGEVPPSVEVDQLQELAFRTLDESMWVFGDEGMVDSMELVFTERGNPTIRVTMLSPIDGRVLGTAQYDLDGNVMALEENQ